jgi:hypothetical protein
MRTAPVVDERQQSPDRQAAFVAGFATVSVPLQVNGLLCRNTPCATH